MVMDQSDHYDLIVVGSGAGNSVAVSLAQAGWKVALIEQGPIGGTCLNRGCIPSKIIIHSAEVVETIKSAEKFGIRAHIDSINFEAVIKRASQHVDEESHNMEQGLENWDKIDLVQGAAHFVGPKNIRVGGREIRAGKILIAAGARPTIPPIEGLESVEYLTSTEALRLTKQPKSMIIIGGGYIAAELGFFYAALGTQVTIVGLDKLMIAREDADVAELFTKKFGRYAKLLLGHKVTKIHQDRDSHKLVHVASDSGHQVKLKAEALLVAVGIRPNSDTLEVEKAGIKIDQRGYIETNQFLETNIEGVWALGDIIGKAPFRHGANWEANHVIHNLSSKHRHGVDYSVMPHAIFSSPQVAGVGLTELQAREQKIDYQVRRRDYGQIAMGKTLEQHDGFAKFIIDKKHDKIIGAHIIGPHASILIHEVVVAMKSAGGKVSAIRDAIHIHPALSELIDRAL